MTPFLHLPRASRAALCCWWMSKSALRWSRMDFVSRAQLQSTSSSSADADSSQGVALEVAAEVTAGGHWKACLSAQKVGGDYTVTATSNAKAAASIEHVTFGDVYYCSGQSNMAL